MQKKEPSQILVSSVTPLLLSKNVTDTKLVRNLAEVYHKIISIPLSIILLLFLYKKMEESHSSTAKKVAQRIGYGPMEPIEKRRCLTRFLTSLASATF